jgi:MFS family permease
MTRRILGVSAVGAGVGAVLGLIVLAAMAGLVIEDGVSATLLDAETSRARAQFATTRGATYLFVLVVTAIGGGVIAALTRGLANMIDPETERPPFGVMVLLGMVIGAIAGYGAFRIGFGIGGVGLLDANTGENFLITSVFRGTMIAAISGAAVGLFTAPTTDVLSDLSSFGAEGAAWPSAPSFRKETAIAIGTGLIALAAIAVIVVGLSQALLEGKGTIAVIVAGSVAALILIVAAWVAYHPDEPQSRTFIIVVGLVVIALIVVVASFVLVEEDEQGHSDSEALVGRPAVSVVAPGTTGTA